MSLTDPDTVARMEKLDGAAFWRLILAHVLSTAVYAMVEGGEIRE